MKDNDKISFNFDMIIEEFDRENFYYIYSELQPFLDYNKEIFDELNN